MVEDGLREIRMIANVLLGIMIPFIGTALGAAFALVGKKAAGATGLISGFAAGVMLAASVWSLIIPSVEMTEGTGVPAFVPPSVGILLGMAALSALDVLLPTSGKSSKLLMIAVTTHNVPEGMAVGAVFAGLIAGSEGITLAAAMSLSIGIALQNVPEGAIVGLPLVKIGAKKSKACLMGIMSGAVEPIAALITIALYMVAVTVLPYLLSFAAGCMIYVAIKELAPELGEGKFGMAGLGVGFVLMMVLDLAL